MRVGRESRHAYKPDSITAARTYLDDMSAQWDTVLARLRAHVED